MNSSEVYPPDLIGYGPDPPQAERQLTHEPWWSSMVAFSMMPMIIVMISLSELELATNLIWCCRRIDSARHWLEHHPYSG